MRRFIWVASLLFGFSGNRYAWTVRVPTPVPVVQPVEMLDADGTRRGPAWWQS
ncbi:MAG: hypothetical protein ABI555_08095 [Chloroflexota bacterium]